MVERKAALTVAVQQPPLNSRAHLFLLALPPALVVVLVVVVPPEKRCDEWQGASCVIAPWARTGSFFFPIFGSAKATFRHFRVATDVFYTTNWVCAAINMKIVQTRWLRFKIGVRRRVLQMTIIFGLSGRQGKALGWKILTHNCYNNGIQSLPYNVIKKAIVQEKQK